MSPIKTYVEDGILQVTLDRPKANAIDLATSKIMGETFAAFRDDPSLRVAIITGAGEKFFCPGWDLKAAADGDGLHDADVRGFRHGVSGLDVAGVSLGFDHSDCFAHSFFCLLRFWVKVT